MQLRAINIIVTLLLVLDLTLFLLQVLVRLSGLIVFSARCYRR